MEASGQETAEIIREGDTPDAAQPMSENTDAKPDTTTAEADTRHRRSKARKNLHDAVYYGGEDEVELLLREGADPNALNSSHQTPLHVAVARNLFDIAEILLEHGADPNIVTKLQETPLHIAAKDGSLKMTSLLLKRKAKLNLVNKSRLTPLHLSAKRRHHDITSLLLARNGINIGIPDSHKRTVLHYACANGWVDIVTKLLSKEASVDAQDDKKRTPLYDAAGSGNVKVVDKLIAAGASVHNLDARNKTPIFEAANQGSVEIAKKLIAKGALVNIADTTGKTPLHFASLHDHADVVELLISHGASVNAASHDGSKPIHESLRYGSLRAADQLLEHVEIDLTIRNTLAHGNRAIEVIEPPLEKLLRLPHAGRRQNPADLSVSVPSENSEQEKVCKGLEVAVWPWPPEPFVLATPTVHELLYGSLPEIMTMPDGATWIHIPANNRVWIEDLFKALYAPEESDQPDDASDYENDTDGDNPTETSGSETDQDSSTETSGSERHGGKHDIYTDRRRPLSSILAFIRAEFRDNLTKTQRPAKEKASDQMVMVALPIIDIDMRGPYYDTKKAQAVDVKGREETEKGNHEGEPEEPNGDHEASFAQKVKEYTIDEGGRPTEAEESYSKLMESLRSTYGQVDPPVSLDEYFHESIDADDLNVRNGDQVMSRFIARQRVEWENGIGRQQTGNMQGGEGLADQNGSTGTENQQHQVTMANNTPSQLEAGLGTSLQPSEHSAQEPHSFRQRIITIPRIWVWKIDESTIVTSCPQRWDETSRLSPLPRTIWMHLMELALKRQREQRREVPLDADDMFFEILQACLQFRPSFRLAGKEYTFPDVFAAEIAFVSREVTKFYRTYKNSLGKSVEDFSKSIKLATECLITIDDILNEITMIRRVYRDQGRILLSTSDAGKDSSSMSSSGGYDSSEWGYEGMRTAEDKYIIARLKHLEKDAQMVRKSITTLLDLRQRQVTIEMALSSEVQSDTLFKQSSILFIFTLATVLFTPLSWVSSLMALKIDEFSPDSWPQTRVVAASFGSVLGTIALCALGLAAYLKHQNHLLKSKKHGSV